MSAFSTETMRLVKERSGGWDEVTGLPLQGPGHHHHRKPRGMGGTGDPGKDSPANCLYVSARTHERIEADRAVALSYGWLVEQTADPALVPVWTAGLGWVLLDDEGGWKTHDVGATLV